MRLGWLVDKVLNSAQLNFFLIDDDLIRQVTRYVKSAEVLVLERRKGLIQLLLIDFDFVSFSHVHEVVLS